MQTFGRKQVRLVVTMVANIFVKMAVILKFKMMAMIIVRKLGNIKNVELWIVANVEIKYTRI